MNVRRTNQVRYKEAESPRFGATVILIEYRSNKCLSQWRTTDIVVLLEVTELQPVAKMLRHSHEKTTFLASNRSWSHVCEI